MSNPRKDKTASVKFKYRAVYRCEVLHCTVRIGMRTTLYVV